MVQQNVLVILGPTAVGKTEIGQELAIILAAEIISADSMQIYRGMDIGTAKASLQDQKTIKYHMLDVVEPDQSFNVADYVTLAEHVLKKLKKQAVMPILSGGTGLYIDALLKGFLFPDAPADQNIRRELERESQENPDSLYEKLQKVDPPSAKKLHPNDQRRIVRALEVFYRTGKPISLLQKQKEKECRPYRPLYIGLTRDREALYTRIDLRVEQMIQRGLVEEVRHLLQAYPQQPTALQALGYKEIVQYLEGKVSLPDAIEILKRDTRRYAKRQMSWFKRNQATHWFNRSEMTDKEIKATIHSLWMDFIQEPF